MTLSPATRRWLGLLAVALGVSLIVVDTTIVNVIVPSLVAELGITSSQAQWVQESYPIVLAALLLLTGRVADLVGPRRVFITGVVLFVAASVLAGAAPTGEILVTARFAQGAAAAMLLPTSLALVNTVFTGAERARAFALWGATLGVSAALGPLLGGAFAQVSWRWAFGINVPLGVLILAGVLAFLPASQGCPGRVDVPGAALSVVGLGLLSFALIEGRTYGWITSTRPFEIGSLSWHGGPSPVAVALVVSAVALFFLVRRQLRLSGRGDVEPLMDVRLFAIPSFRKGTVTLLIIGLGEFGIVAVLPLWFQFALGYSPLLAGFALMPLALGSFAASTASMGLAGRVIPLHLVRVGLLLEIAGLVGLALVAAPDRSWWPVALVLFVFGIGTGFATAQIANVILAEVPAESAGRGSAVHSAAAQIGSAFGIAVLTTTFYSALSLVLGHRLLSAGFDPALAEHLTGGVTSSAGAVIPSLESNPHTAAAADAARASMANSVSAVSLLASALLVCALVATALIPRTKATQHEPTRTGGGKQ